MDISPSRFVVGWRCATGLLEGAHLPSRLLTFLPSLACASRPCAAAHKIIIDTSIERATDRRSDGPIVIHDSDADGAVGAEPTRE